MLLRTMSLCGAVWIASSWTVAADSMSGAVRDQASEILDPTGVPGGLIVHLGCGDGRLTAAFAKDGYIVQGLETDEKQVSTARKVLCIASTRREGDSQVVRWPTSPISGQLRQPAGWTRACVAFEGRDPAGAGARRRGVSWTRFRWEKIVKPPRHGVDEWTHYLHDASGNAVAHDTVVSPPKHLQWVAGPEWSRTHSHMGSMMGLVSARGRVFAIADEGSIAYPNVRPTGLSRLAMLTTES